MGGCLGLVGKCGMVEMGGDFLRMRKEKNVGKREKIAKCRKKPNTSENSLEEWMVGEWSDFGMERILSGFRVKFDGVQM